MSESVTAKEVEQHLRRKLKRLLSQPGEKSLKKALAELRRGVGKLPGEEPRLWGYLLEDLPERFLGDQGPSRGEWAVYIALTLFALHQQGRDPKKESMNQDGCSLGRAVRLLVEHEEDEQRIERRFFSVATAADMPELSHHMRMLIQLLRDRGIPLDYPLLAGDLYRYQFPALAPHVRLKWGRDFYRPAKREKERKE